MQLDRTIQMTRRGSPVDVIVTSLEEAEGLRQRGWTMKAYLGIIHQPAAPQVAPQPPCDTEELNDRNP